MRIAIANENGLPGEELHNAEMSERVQSLNRQYSEEAEELGVFGAPTYVFNGERFLQPAGDCPVGEFSA